MIWHKGIDIDIWAFLVEFLKQFIFGVLSLVSVGVCSRNNKNVCYYQETDKDKVCKSILGNLIHGWINHRLTALGIMIMSLLQ